MSVNDAPQLGADQTGSLAGFQKTVQYDIYPERRLVMVRFGAKVNAHDIARYANQLRMSREFQPTFSEIVDLRQVEKLELRAEDFLELADQIDPFSVDAKRAFVVRTSVQNHAARLHKILHRQRHFEIFRSMEDAEEWAGN
ncbi:MAG TPA: hypothetical protein VKV39_10885 [Candidatus Sulfotelmatobacter sp.]|nr:hypothetical protein [Candidatus Sulfotelmatobacter sp.]